MTKIDKQKGSIYSKNSRWCPNVSEWFRFLYLPLTTFHAVLQSRTRHGNAPTSKALTFAGMQYVLRKKYLPKWLLQSLLNFSYAESHIPQVFQLTEAGNTRSRYQSKQKTVPSLQQLQETLATSTSPPLTSWKYKILLLMKSFISYLEKILKLILRRIFIFNNFPQLSETDTPSV